MEQLNLEYETFATEEEVARLKEAYKLACYACNKGGIIEYRSNPDKGTYHTRDGWMTHFLEIAGGREPKIVEIAFAVDPCYPTFDEYE